MVNSLMTARTPGAAHATPAPSPRWRRCRCRFAGRSSKRSKRVRAFIEVAPSAVLKSAARSTSRPSQSRNAARADFDVRQGEKYLGCRDRTARTQGLQGLRFRVGSSAQRLGDHAVIQARLQMHATDPDQLERRLGTAQSKGCIRIPASLNIFLDRFSVLDQDYEQGLDDGRRLW